MSNISTTRSVSFALALMAPLLAAAPAMAACPDPAGFQNFEFTSQYQSNLAKIKFTPAVSQTVADRLANPIGTLPTGTTIAILDGFADIAHVDLCGHATTKLVYSGTYTKLDLHGTHVSGLAGAIQNGSGLVGVDPFSRLLNIPVFDDTGWRPGDLGKAALDYARVDGARVVNMSYGSTKRGAVFLPGELNLFKNYNSATPGQGLVIARAAGNDGATISNQGYAGDASVDLSNLLIVGSVNSSNVISSFSNRPGNACMTGSTSTRTRTSPCTTKPANYVKNFFIVAPGENIWSDAPGQSIASLSGTSMATPQVAGAAGLVIQNALAGNVQLTPGQVANILKLSATHLGASAAGTPDTVYGWGLLNVEAAINRPAGGSSVATQSTVSGGGAVSLSQSSISASSGSMMRMGIEQGLSDMVIFDGFGRPFTMVGPKTTETVTTTDASDHIARLSSVASLHRTPLFTDEHYAYSMTRSGGGAGLGVNVLSLTGDTMRADFGIGAAATYFASAPLPGDAPSYSRDLAGLFFASSGEAGNTLRQEASIFAAIDNHVAPGLVMSSVLIKTAPDSLAGLSGAEAQPLSGDRPFERRDETSLIRTGARYDVGAGVSLGASYGILFEQGTTMGMRSSGAFSLGDQALTQIFGASVKYDTGNRSSIQVFADRSRTSSTHRGDSLFSAIDDWRGSKFGLAYETTQMFNDSDAVRLIVARPWQVDQGTLALHVPVGREFDGTVNYDDRIVAAGTDAAPLDFTMQYRGGEGDFVTYAFEAQMTDRDLRASGGREATVMGALQLHF